MRTIGAIVVTAGAVAASLLAGCGGSTSEPATTAGQPQPAESSAPTTAQETVTTAATTESATTAPATSGETEPAEPSAPPVPVIRIRGGQPVDGVETITVKNGEVVRFVVQADAPEEVHVHGFDVSKEVGPGKDARFAFKAEFEGIFEVELENSAVKIAEIAVEPS